MYEVVVELEVVVEQEEEVGEGDMTDMLDMTTINVDMKTMKMGMTIKVDMVNMVMIKKMVDGTLTGAEAVDAVDLVGITVAETTVGEGVEELAVEVMVAHEEG